ncbi:MULTISPECIES: hypothetical protein [unclassified Pseudomonas]|uniref:hypothetical protein n=1 Tax=unclassified Pseudomonas TaxID=196821 RepID=UPI0002706E7C|nr:MULTISPECIES: hypothetical protein [unclassified Pseudomonas]EJM79600.1 hypothetical protein PMI32_04192 [Pseudomonas sp. GM60]
MQDIFLLEPQTKVDRKKSYIRSYPHILGQLQTGAALTERDFVCGAHIVYGWMPTILDLYPTAELTLQQGADLLNKARTKGVLSESEMANLAALVNNSVVGASKLLHFVNPDAFAIWDSKIYRFIHGQAAHQYRVNNAGAYLKYLDLLNELREDKRFPDFHSSINEKMGYPVSPRRAIEVVMFLNA